MYTGLHQNTHTWTKKPTTESHKEMSVRERPKICMYFWNLNNVRISSDPPTHPKIWTLLIKNIRTLVTEDMSSMLTFYKNIVTCKAHPVLVKRANQVWSTCGRTKGSLAPCLVAARSPGWVYWRPHLAGTRQYLYYSKCLVLVSHNDKLKNFHY